MADGKPCSSIFPVEYYNETRSQTSLLTRQQLDTAQKAMKDEKIESRLANDTRNTRYVFHCSPVVKHRRCRLLLINRNGNRSP